VQIGLKESFVIDLWAFVWIEALTNELKLDLNFRFRVDFPT
jgi:hypothetical protein